MLRKGHADLYNAQQWKKEEGERLRGEGGKIMDGHVCIFGYVWLCLAMFGYVWLCLAVFGCLTMYAYIWLYMAIYGYLWLGYVGVCMAMCGYVWLTMEERRR